VWTMLLSRHVISTEAGSEKRRVACHAVVLETFPPQCRSGIWPSFPWVGEVAHGSRWAQAGDMPRIDDLSDGEFMKLQAEYGDSLPICPICMLEDVQHLLLELVAGDAVSDEVKSALAPMLYAVTGALVADRTMAEQGGGSAHLGGDEDNDDDGASPRTQ
jgi:hypothetical protein